MDYMAIIDAARALRRMLRDADEDTLTAAYQIIAADANNSAWAYMYEPMSGLAVTLQAELRQRAHKTNAGDGAVEASSLPGAGIDDEGREH